MHKNIRILCLAVLLGIAFSPVLSAADNTIVLHVIGPESGYVELQLEDKLGHILSGLRDYELLWANDIKDWLDEENRRDRILYSRELQMDLADRFDAGYIIWVRVLDADSYIKSGTLVPFVFKSHKRKFRIETEYRIIDSRTGKVLTSKKLKENSSGSRSLAYLDLDAYNEPALMSSYPDQLRAFSDLEDRVAEKITKQFLKVTKNR
jgi:hypothetical protein